MHNHDFFIAELISAYLSGTIEDEKLIQLNQWRSESTQNELLFQKICNKENIRYHLKKVTPYNKEKGINSIQSRIKFRQRKQVTLSWIKYASMIIIPLALGIFLFVQKNNEKSPLLSETKSSATEILPGGKKAVLTFGNGEKIELGKDIENTTLDKNGTTIDINKTGVNYHKADNLSQEKEEYNKLDIPRGGEYVLVLSDNSKVHLNTMSSLHFPVQFKGEKRIVELEGEAFFDVAPNSKPFIVKIEGMEIEVFGTSFNVSAYSGENSQTTLVSGSIKVSADNSTNSRILVPSEQAIFNSSTKEIGVNKVDITLYTSWVKGKIYFKDQRLEDIMNSLSRWYDMEVVYETAKTKDIRFGCNLDRYQEMNPFLELLEKTGKVKIRALGKKIIISQ